MRARNQKKAFSAVDLFSGCGGLTLGLKKAGFQVLGAVDNDALSMETYKANHAEVKTWELDIRKLAASRVMRGLRLRPGQLDLLAGCPPCQGFSAMRTLNGSKRARDPRNDLVFDFLRFVRVLRPKTVMLENVPGLAKDRRIRQFRRKLRRLSYGYKCDVLNAANYGVPQRRRRMILVASRVFEPSFAEPSTSRRTVRDAFTNLTRPGATKDPLHRGGENRTPRIAAMIRRIPRNGGSRNALGRRKQLECHRNFEGFRDVYGRIAWSKVAPTITGGCINPSKGRFLHPSQNRAITLREAALLQGFPRSYRISLRRGRYPAAALIGNALPPEFVRRHALELLKSLGSPAAKKRTQ
jgi:DNA (cytosine-5)-methyltransferase 1